MTKQRLIWISATAAVTTLIVWLVPTLVALIGARVFSFGCIVVGFVGGILVTLNNVERARRLAEAAYKLRKGY